MRSDLYFLRNGAIPQNAACKPGAPIKNLACKYRSHEDPVRTCSVNCRAAAKKIYIGAILLRNCSMLGLHVHMHVVKAIEGSYVVTCPR